jgi:DNA-binding SARP family transcriptional activator
MEFGLLGPLVVRRGGADVPVPKGKQRALLSVLLLNAGRVVPVPVLAEALWGPQPPPSAEASIWNYVKRLRQALGNTGRERLCTRPPGYLIRVADDELDVLKFEALLDAARAAAREGAWADAAGQARAALGLWRGEPLADAGSDTLALSEVPRLAELRVQAVETRLEADLRLGRHAEMIAELERLIAALPLREHLYCLLMLALYRCGRQAEALGAYQRARDVLVAELGVEPGPALRELHQQILAADPALAVADPAPAPAAQAEPQRVTPRELPPTVPGFTGRSAELRALTALLDRSGQRAAGAVVISAIGGTAGVGKTALAVHWAHQVADRFPNGQLYVNLRGYDLGSPMSAGDALAGFLRALGVPGQDIPPEENERAARYRSLLAGKRMLVVLDNAGSADQVRPLLPGTPGCIVVVTSRDALAGLVARDGASRLDLDMLPPAEAVALLRTLIGPRVDAEPEAATGLADQCCRLPLALRVAAELAATRPAASLAGLSGELADLRTRLDLLEAGGDPRTQVRTVFSWSYRHLDADAARAFRLLGLHPGPDFGPYAVAALAGATVPQARTLDTLARAHLISPAAPGRYGLHDLLRAYARELSATADGGDERQAALTRLFDHYLHAAAAAMDTLFPAERHRRPRIPQPDTPVPPLADAAAAREWLDAERAVLVAAAGHAAAHDRPGHTTRLAATLFRYLLSGGHYPEARTVLSHALGAARRNGDRAAEATALNDIGLVDGYLGRYQQAADQHRQALALFRAAGDRTGETRALSNLGLDETALGHYEQAARHEQDAAAISRDIGDRFGESRALGNLGLARQRQGRYQEAVRYHQQSLDLFREIGDRQGEGLALSRLGGVELLQGRCQHATGYLQQSLTVLRETGGSILSRFEVLAGLGEAYAGLGLYEQAAGHFEQVLAISRKIGNRVQEADALNGLGDVLLRTGDAGKARAHHATALRLLSEADSPRTQARAHSGLARACQASGDSLQARYHWQEALTRYTAIGAPEADEIRARLVTADDSGDDGDKPLEGDRGTTASSAHPATALARTSAKWQATGWP